jgi:hypothetical protein
LSYMGFGSNSIYLGVLSILDVNRDVAMILIM